MDDPPLPIDSVPDRTVERAASKAFPAASGIRSKPAPRTRSPTLSAVRPPVKSHNTPIPMSAADIGFLRAASPKSLTKSEPFSEISLIAPSPSPQFYPAAPDRVSQTASMHHLTAASALSR